MTVWSTVGSAGVASAADQSKLLLFNSIVQLGPGTGVVIGRVGGGLSASSSPSGPELLTLGTQVTAVIRYGVDVSQDALAGVAGMRIRYRDGNGIVTARLIAVDFDTGVESDPPLLVFDSRGDPPPKPGFQTRFATPADGGGIVVPFKNAAFYIELTLAVFQPFGVLVAFPPALSAMAIGD